MFQNLVVSAMTLGLLGHYSKALISPVSGPYLSPRFFRNCLRLTTTREKNNNCLCNLVHILWRPQNSVAYPLYMESHPVYRIPPCINQFPGSYVTPQQVEELYLKLTAADVQGRDVIRSCKEFNQCFT